MKNLFTEHPASVDETYFEHMGMSASFSATLAVASLAALVHAILPFMFEKTASRLIGRLHDRMVVNRNRNAAPTTPNGALDWQI